MLANSITAFVEKDAFLWKEMKAGNEGVFREIFETYSNLLFQYGLTISNDRELVKDCVQQLFITVWTHRYNLGIVRSIKYYLIFSLRRLLLKKTRKKQKFFSLTSFCTSEILVEAQDQLIINRESNVNHQLVIARALEKLPARQREVIFLKFYQELNNEEIEKIMNLNNQVVRNTLCKALHSLRTHVKSWERTAFYLVFIFSLISQNQSF